MKLQLTILTLLIAISSYSQKPYKGTISVSPDMFISNKKFVSFKYYGGTVEFLGNIKNTSLGIGMNMLNNNDGGKRTMTVGYLTARQSFPIQKFVPYAFAAFGYGRVKMDIGLHHSKEKGTHYHAGAGLRYKALPYLEPFISAKYSSYYNGRINYGDENGNIVRQGAYRINGVAMSLGVAFNLL